MTSGVVRCVLGHGWGTSSLGLSERLPGASHPLPSLPPSTPSAASKAFVPLILPWTSMTLGMRFDNLPTPVALTVGEGPWAKSWQDSVPSSPSNFLSVQVGKEDPLPQSPCRESIICSINKHVLGAPMGLVGGSSGDRALNKTHTGCAGWEDGTLVTAGH